MYYVLGKIRFSILNKIEKLYKEKYKATLGKILFGLNGNIDEEITENFRDAGISHVLAISGLHITYVVFLISFILDKCIKNIKLKNVVISIFLLLFVILTGLSPSCIRACLMTIMMIISKIIHRKNNIIISIIFSFSILILFNMYVIYNIGMWLSFFGTLGIVLFNKFLKLIFKLKMKNKVSKVIDIILVSFSAQILIWPIIMYVFNHLLKIGITKIDYMIYSHMDSDHAGGLMYILENMKVENVLIGNQAEASENLDSLLNLLKERY